MKEIQLTKGKVTIVDDEDFEYLNQWKWSAVVKSNTIYAKRGQVINGKFYIIPMHRSILNPTIGLEVDHINRNGLDNRRNNLRCVSHAENCRNRKEPIKSRGVGVYKVGKKYKSQKMIKGILYYLGIYKTYEEAREKYINFKMI
jgi:hypothetical protein